MSKINHVIELIKNNPTASRSDLISKIVEELNVSKANAGVYFYNAMAKIEKGVSTEKPVKAAKPEKKVAAKTEKVKVIKTPAVKSEKKEVVKQAAAKRSSNMRDYLIGKEIDIDGIQASIEDHDADDFVRSVLPKSVKKELGLD